MLIKLNFKFQMYPLINTLLLLLTFLASDNHGIAEGINYMEYFTHVNPYVAPELVQEYSWFSQQVNRALGIQEDNLNETTNGPPQKQNLESSLVGLRTGSGLDTLSSPSVAQRNYKSAIGISNILAVVRENIWDSLELADPSLEQAVRSSPSSLPSFMGSLLKSAELDYNTKIRSIIFTPTWVKTTLRLTELKTEVKQAFFDIPQQAMDTVNNVIQTRFPDIHNFPDFLTEPLPFDTESLLVNMKQQRGHWPTATGYVGSTIFNGTGYEENVEMFEIRGKFPYFLDQEFIYVTIPFKMTKLALTLALAQDQTRSQWLQDDGHGGHEAHFRLHLPVKTFISRNSIKTDSRSCNEQRGRDFGHCMEFLDTLSYTSFTPNEFQFINLNGGVVRRQGHLYQNNHQNRLRSSPILERWRSFVPSRKHLRYHNNFNYQKIWKWKLPSANSNFYSNTFHNYNNRYTDIALVFNRPFYWFVRSTV